MKIFNTLFISQLFFVVFLLSACGGTSSSTPKDEEIQLPPKTLELVAGRLGGRGNTSLGKGRFADPTGLALSKNGILYVADTNGGPLRKISPNGLIQDIALNNEDLHWRESWRKDKVETMVSRYLVIDAEQNVYVGDLDNCRILKVTPSDQVSVYAGSSCGYRDGTRLNAQFASVGLLTMDKKGVLYVGDTNNHTVRKITPKGDVTTLAGKQGEAGTLDGAAGQARFAKLTSITCDPDEGSVFVVDRYKALRQIRPTGEVQTLKVNVSDMPPTNSSAAYFDYSFLGSLFYEAGTIYASSVDLLVRINEIKTNPRMLPLSGVNRNESDDFLGFYFYATDNDYPPDSGLENFMSTPGQMIRGSDLSTMYYADAKVSVIREVKHSLNSTYTSVVSAKYGAAAAWHTDGFVTRDSPVAKFYESDAPLYRPLELEDRKQLVLDAAGNIHISYPVWYRNYAPRASYRAQVSPQGQINLTSFSKDNFPSLPPLTTPQQKTYWADYIVMYTKVLDANKQERIEVLAGNTDYQNYNKEQPIDGLGSAAYFKGIQAYTVDEMGNIYLIDRKLSDYSWKPDMQAAWIRKISPNGQVTTIAGQSAVLGHADGPGYLAQFNGPMHITRDPQNNLYVADAFNHVIRKIRPDGYVSTFAGTPKVAGNKNGLASQASFNEPNLLCFDKHGNLYVSDSGNFLVRKITPQGQVSTVVGISGIRGVALGKLPTSISFVSGMHVDQNDVMYLYSENSLLKIQL